MTFGTKLVDDDGILVIGSPTSLRNRYASRRFDYTFPNALIEGMHAGELFAWRTGFEGEHTISVDVVSADAFAAEDADGTHEHRIALTNGGLLMVPYSQFTSGCDDGGRFEVRAGLAALAPIPPGDYRVRVARAHADDSGCTFRVSLTQHAANAPQRSVKEIPGWRD